MKKIFFIVGLLMAIDGVVHARTWPEWWKEYKYRLVGGATAVGALATAAYLNRDRLRDTYGNAGRGLFGLNKKDEKFKLNKQEQEPTAPPTPNYEEQEKRDYKRMQNDPEVIARRAGNQRRKEGQRKAQENSAAGERSNQEGLRNQTIESNNQPSKGGWWPSLRSNLGLGSTAHSEGERIEDQRAKPYAGNQQAMPEMTNKGRYSFNKEAQRKHIEELNQRETPPSVPWSQRLRNRANKYFETAEEGRQMGKAKRREMKDYARGTIVPKAVNAVDFASHDIAAKFIAPLIDERERSRYRNDVKKGIDIRSQNRFKVAQEKEMNEKAQENTYRANKEKQRQRTEELNQIEKAPSVPWSQRLRNRANKYFQTAEEGRQMGKANRREMKDYVHGTAIPTAKNALFDVAFGTQGTEATDRIKEAQENVNRINILRTSSPEERKAFLYEEEGKKYDKFDEYLKSLRTLEQQKKDEAWEKLPEEKKRNTIEGKKRARHESIEKELYRKGLRN